MSRRQLVSCVAVIVGVTSMSSCGSSAPLTPTAPSTVLDNVAVPSGPPGTLLGAGDVALCDAPGATRTAALLDDLRGTVIIPGDIAYPTGSMADFRNCFDPAWGRHRSRIRPVPGNHEYDTPGAAGFFEYFGGAAGPAGLGYYSFTVGPWLVLAINSEVPAQGGSAQYEWVRGELARDSRLCTAAFWHRPLFSSGTNGPQRDMLDMWRLLHAQNVDLVINGHEHIYERFAPQTPDGGLDPVEGIRQFTIGTGGAPQTAVGALARNSEIAASAWGIARFTLHSHGYTWDFVPAAGESFRDSGAGSCH